MFLHFYRMISALAIFLIFGLMAAGSAWAIDVTVTNTSDAIEGSTSGNFTISTDSIVASDTVIDFTLSGTANDEVGESDYNAIPNFVIISSGNDSANVTISTLNDNTSEVDETVILTLTSTDNASVVVGAANVATITIADDDAPTVSIQSIDDLVEGTSVTTGQFRFLTSNPVDGGLTITYTYSGTATYRSDYRDASTTVTNTVTIAETDADLEEVVTLTLLEDDVAEGLETITATIINLSRTGGIIDPDNATASIALTSDDTVEATIVSGTSGAETGTDATFIVNLSSVATVPITIEYLDASSTADNGTDYVNLPAAVTIPAGSISTQISVTVLDDNDNDAGETIALELDRVSSGPAVIGSPSLASSVIIDDDQALATIVAGQNAAEVATDNASFTVQLDQPASADITVSFTLLGTASSLDYTSPANIVNFSQGEQSQTIVFPVLDDNISEGTETLIVRLDSTTGPVAIGAQNTATRLILDDDIATLTIDQNPPNGDESSDTDTAFTIRTNTVSSNDITVSYTTSGTATSGADYTALAGFTTIAAGDLFADIAVDVLNDNRAEDDETVIITLQNITSGSAVLGQESAVTLTITDNDTVAAGLGQTVNASEDNSSADGNFIISLASVAEADITITYSLSGTADNNTDYAALPGAVTIAAGETIANVVIDPIDDSVVEGAETVILTLIDIAGGPGQISGTPSASLTIADNDAAAISLSRLTDGAEGGVNGRFLVSANAAAPSGYDISYSVSGTVDSSDYTDSGGGVITIAAGDDNATITFLVTDDTIIEDDETLTVTLTAVTAGVAQINADDNASIIITSDDRATATIANGTNAEESGLVDGALTVSLDTASTIPITFGYVVTGTATSGADYAALPGSLTFAAGSTEETIAIDVLDDSIYEDNETVIITLSEVTDGPGVIGTPDAASNIITSDDNASLSVTVTASAEEPNTDGIFLVRIPQAVNQDVSFDYSITSSSTATAGTDYTIIGSSPQTIPQGDDSVAIMVRPLADQLVEPDETIIIEIDRIIAGPAVISSADSATMILYDNNTQPVTLTAPDNGSETGPDDASLLISVPSVTTTDIVVDYEVTGTATEGSDYAALPGRITIDSGTSSRLINIPVIDDNLDEDNETIIITLTSIVSGPGRVVVTNNQNSVTITDNDNSSLSISVSPETDEGTDAIFTATLSSASSGDVTLTYADNGTASRGLDYTSPSGTLVIPSGQRSGTIAIPIISDGLADSHETLSLTITAITGTAALVSSPSATTSLIDSVDVGSLLSSARIATRKAIRGDLSGSLDDIRRTAERVVDGGVNRLSDENSHDYDEACSHDDRPSTSVDVDANNRAIKGRSTYQKTTRKCYSTEVTIASADVNFTDDGEGNETTSVDTVLASERTAQGLYSKYGRYIELSIRNREQTKANKGEIDSVRVNIGGYMVYRTAASAFLSSYITFGASQSTYDLTHERVKSTGSYLAFNIGTGAGLTGEIKGDHIKFSPNIAVDFLATGYSSFDGDFKVNGKTYKRKIDQSILHQARLSFKPKFHIYSSSRFAEARSVTTLAPSIFCTASSLDNNCGYSFLAENTTRNIIGADVTAKLGYEALGDTATTSLSLTANTYLFDNSFIKLANEIAAEQDQPKDASRGVKTDPKVSYKVYIEMLY
jgi:hypothetical protein